MAIDLPAISLIIRTWNEAAHIQETLNAAYEQTFIPDEIIVVDSGSSDGTIDKLSGYDVELIQIPHEQFTYGYALNIGAQHARGDFLISLSAHALPVNPLWLRNLVRPLMTDLTTAGTSSHQLPFKNQSLESYLVFWQTLYKWGLKTPIVERYLFSNACSAIRSHLWRQTPFDETVDICEDHQWAIKMQRKGYHIAYASNSLVYHSHQMVALAVARRRFRELRALFSFYVSRPNNFRF